MRVNVSLNNEDGAHFEHQHQQQQVQQAQYCHDPYGRSADSQQYYASATQQHIASPPAMNSSPYTSSNNMNHTSNQYHMLQAPQSQSHTPYQSPSLAASTTGGYSTMGSQSFYGGSSDDEVQSTHSAGGSSIYTQEASQSAHHHPQSTACSVGGKKLRPMGTPVDHRGHVDPSRFKTEPCSYYARGEACPYTPQCAFAHGETEKRSRRRNVREGVSKVNTLPRTLVYHEAWVQTTKYTRKTGPSTCGPAGFVPSAAAPITVPAPSFRKA